jgi:hypothetical protein
MDYFHLEKKKSLQAEILSSGVNYKQGWIHSMRYLQIICFCMEQYDTSLRVVFSSFFQFCDVAGRVIIY